MQFLLLYRPTRPENVPMKPEQMMELGAMCAEMAKAGVMLTSGGLHPSAKGAKVRYTQGKVTVTDGPFTEAKEVIAGFNLIEASSKADAIELARRFIQIAGDGETEIRQLYGPSDFPQ
jgi:hypothetical protein